MKTAQFSKQNGSSPLLMIFIIVIILIAGGFFVFSNKYNETTRSTITNQQPSSSTSTNSADLSSVFSTIENTYSGNVPWANINNRQAYQFYPLEINGLTLSNNEVSTYYDNNYNPITVIKLGDSNSVPVKNAYLTYYQIPTVLADKYNIDKSELVLPVELYVYEFDRALNENERTMLIEGDNFICKNDKARTEKLSFVNENIAVHSCNLNLTSEQKSQVANRGFFDSKYEIYFPNRNIIVQFGFDSKYIDNPQAILSDYLSKLLNSNDSLFINQKQIQTIEDARKFEEWRSKTFDKK